MERYVGIDIGGTAIKYGILNDAGEFICRSEMRTEAYKGGTSILSKAVGIVDRYRETAKIDGICISTAGMVDTGKGRSSRGVADSELCGNLFQRGDGEQV